MRRFQAPRLGETKLMAFFFMSQKPGNNRTVKRLLHRTTEAVFARTKHVDSNHSANYHNDSSEAA